MKDSLVHVQTQQNFKKARGVEERAFRCLVGVSSLS